MIYRPSQSRFIITFTILDPNNSSYQASSNILLNRSVASKSLAQILTSIRLSPSKYQVLNFSPARVNASLDSKRLSNKIQQSPQKSQNEHIDRNIAKLIEEFKNKKKLKQKGQIKTENTQRKPLQAYKTQSLRNIKKIQMKALNLQQSPLKSRQSHKKEEAEQDKLYEYQDKKFVFRKIEYKNTKSRFQLISIIGQGKLSDVYLGKEKQSGILVGIKVIQKDVISKFKVQECVYQEIKIQLCLDNENICKLFGVFEDEDRIYMVLEYADNNLQSWLKRIKNRAQNQNQIGIFMRDIIKAVNYIQLKGIMHRDIKPQNILLCQGMVKLSDFGCSTYFDASSGRLNNTFCGTLDYLAPEMVMDDQNGYYTYKIDNWSIGILGYELMYGQTPFGHIESQDEVLEHIMKNQIQFPQSQKNKDGISLLQQLLALQPENRISLQDALECRWFQNINEDMQNRQLMYDLQMFNLNQ